MRRKRQIPASEDGFTLIELLVSLALLGLSATMLLQGLVTAGLVAQRERNRTIGLDEVIAAQRVLRNGIERLRPILRPDSGIPIIELRGTAGVFTFVGPPLDRAAPDALQRFRLTRTASGELILYSASTRKAGIDLSGPNLIGWTPNPLLHGVRELSIGYLGPARPGMARGWQQAWWDRSSPPELIRIRVRFNQGDPRSWPDLLIRPRATKYGVCRIDGLTGKCGEER